MHSLRDAATRLTNQMQNVIGFLEMNQQRKALEAAKASIVTLHSVSTIIALHIAEMDAIAAEVQQLTAALTAKKRPHSTPM